MGIGETLERLREGGHETYPVASPADVAETEAAVGHPFPDSFKTFVQEFSNGAYLYRVQEVNAVGAGSKQIVAIQNIARVMAGDADEVIPFRDGGETRYGNLVPFGLDSNGNEWCFVVESGRPGNEYEVAYFDTLGRKLYGRLPSFSEWLGVLMASGGENEVIRLLYADNWEVIYEELMLG